MKTEEGVLRYERKRYRQLDQRLVNNIETRIVGKMLAAMDSRMQNVLDVPCGYGRFTPVLMHRSLRLASTDLSAAMVVRCRERAAPLTGNKKGRFVVSDIQHLPFKDNSFDCIFTFRLFQHIRTREQRENILSEISRVTNRWAIISFYRKSIFHLWERRLIRRKTPIGMVTQQMFSREAAAHNLRLKQLSSVFPFLHAQVIALLERSPNPPAQFS